MFFRLLILLICVALPALARTDDGNKDRMDPVVPEKMIPPSPVLSVVEALKSFQLALGFVIEPVVTEPLVDKPVCLDFDSRGRMWVCEMRGYMPDIDGKGEKIPEGRIVILEDTNADGKVDKLRLRIVSPENAHLAVEDWSRAPNAWDSPHPNLSRIVIRVSTPSKSSDQLVLVAEPGGSALPAASDPILTLPLTDW